MPSVCVISDTHCLHRRLSIPECDLLIHCGDMGSFRHEERKNLEDIDRWFSQVPAKQVVCVAGNHDFMLQSGEFRFAHAEYLHDRLVEVQGLSIYGSPWCPDLSGFAFYATDDELIERWKKIPTGIDILITHTPPHGQQDLPTSGLRHLGCAHLMNELRRIRPRYHFFGHVHASRGMVEKDGMVFANAAVVGGSNFEVRHGAMSFEIAAEEVAGVE